MPQSLDQFLEETGKEFDEEFGTHLEWGDGDLIKAPELKSFLLSKIKEGVELENEEWRSRKRCSICGNAMKPQPLTDTCSKCFEEE